MMHRSIGLVLLFFLLPLSVMADAQATEPQYTPLPDPPILSPNPVKSGEQLEPEIKIIEREDAHVTEYRVKGHLYMVKITPIVGQPYYLIDRDGDGEMENRVNNIYQDVATPEWVLFRW